jgi:prepilin-type processing-associated H-X9-DG protein
VLPYIEQDAVWRGSNQPTIAAAQMQAIGAAIKGFFCPSRRAPEAISAGAWYGPGGTYPHGMTDYAACGGLENVADQGALRQNTGSHDGRTLTSIKDGTSNTLLLGDKRLNSVNMGVMQGDDNEGYSSGWDHDVIRWAFTGPLPDPTSGDGGMRFGSSHVGGVNMLMCDGAVRTIAYSINSVTWRALATAAGNEVTTNF